MTIIRNEKGRIEAPEGGHDDDMMGLAIAHHIREQVIFNDETMYVNPQYNFNVERMQQAYNEVGEQITII